MVKNMSYSYPIIIIHPIVNKQFFSWNCNVFVFRIFPWCSDKSRSSYCVLYNKKISHILVGLKSHCIPLIFNYIPILYIVYTYSYDIYICVCVTSSVWKIYLGCSWGYCKMDANRPWYGKAPKVGICGHYNWEIYLLSSLELHFQVLIYIYIVLTCTYNILLVYTPTWTKQFVFQYVYHIVCIYHLVN